ncbi:DNA pilot protein [Blackfly microvirus SF02]|uniref:DNA pilot protein n=1 Tax=Blackfly microvirus SF02 TaxID=2576452 RepID=A0A4P8PRW3_9VIRU|nr:DNA pilot protein [Blackfly microvirus SF02]
MGAAAISGLAELGGGFMSASGAASANAQNAAINAQNIAYQQQQNNQNQTFQNNVNVANWAYQDKVNQQNFDFADKQTNRSQDMAGQQMLFQQNMSNTAYQRAMADMRAAGLNPMLAYSQGGASTPSGAMGQAQNASASGMSGQSYSGVAPKASLAMGNTQEEFGRAVGRVASTAVDTYKAGEQARNIKADTEVKGLQQENVNQDTHLKARVAAKTDADAKISEQELENRKAELENIKKTGGLITANSAAALARAGVDSETSAQYKQRGMPGYPFGERALTTLLGIPGAAQVPAAPPGLSQTVIDPFGSFRK